MFNFSLVLTSTLKLVPKMSLKNGFGIIKNVNNKAKILTSKIFR